MADVLTKMEDVLLSKLFDLIEIYPQSKQKLKKFNFKRGEKKLNWHL